MFLRAAGIVTGNDRRQGTAKSGNPYDTTEITLLTADGQVTFSGPTADLAALIQGSYVDVVVEVSVWNDRIQTRFRSAYDESKLTNLVDSLVSAYQK